ncbi:MAG TPA: flagellar M-ring protein FliF [Calditrichae bacterium]|nr:flagellar M-ring protein FliF [Calditrichia bacterium]
MGEAVNRFRYQLQTFFVNLSPSQKLLLIGAISVALALIIVMLVWTGRPSYDILFADLSKKDAAEIIDKLKEKKIDFRLEEGGKTILVPSGKVYELRLEFASMGLPEEGVIGYEIFDKSNIGMTDFLQKLNYRRALEGELTRTIEEIDAVEKARVHIVIPETRLFQEDQKQPTASVILKLNRARSLSPAKVNGIAHLVASSVEGLEPENVTIVDTRGRILSNNNNPDDLLTMSATQLDFRKKVEEYLTQKAQSMLDRVFGPGNAIVRVNADLDFNQVKKTIEQYDPDNTVVRSEEINEQVTPSGNQANGNGGGAVAAKSTNTITNYEINRTLQQVVESVGNIQHLSVAVLINNKKEKVENPDGETEIKSVPRDPQELTVVEDIVKRAVGFQEERGDEISVNNVDFSLPTADEELYNLDEENPWSIPNIIEKVLIFLAIIGAMVIMQSLFKQVKERNDALQTQLRVLKGEDELLPALPAGAAGAESPQALESGERPLATTSEEDTMISSEDFFKDVHKVNEFNEKIRSYIKENPETATNLLKIWLMEDAE